VHHEQDMRKMGGLWRYLPVTYVVMIIGTLAITGMGIPGVDLGFAGFYSKDTIIDAAFVAGQHGGVASFAFVAGLLAAGLTAYYSWRLIFMTFHGTAKWADADHGHDDHHAHGEEEPTPDAHPHDHKPHESPWTMLGPIVALSLGAIGSGYLFVERFVGEGQVDFWRGSIFTLPSNHVLEQVHGVPEWVVLAPLVLSLLGLAVAFFVYILNEGMGARLAAAKGPLWTFLYNKWFFDELYDLVFVKGAKALGDFFWKVGDQKVIDGLGPNGVAAVSALTGKRVGRWQTGYVYHYAFVMLLGVAGLLSYGFYLVYGA